jgi:UDP-glucose 4-epimerase
MENKKRVLITGSTGFIGKKLLGILKDFEVYQLCNDSSLSGDYIVNLDLRDYDGIKEMINRIQPHIVIHLAARTEVEKSFYEQTTFSEINYVGTVNLIESCRQIKDFDQFIFSSTMETYGCVYTKEEVLTDPWSLLPFDENTIQKPNAPYAVAKLACEKYLEYAGRCFNFPYTILRQTNTYGREDNDFFVVERIITQMLKGGEVRLGEKEPWRNFIYIDDLVELYRTIILNPKAIGEVFCTGPSTVLSIRELADIISIKIGWDGEIIWDTRPKRDGEIYYLNSYNTKAESILGWKPLVSLSEGLDKTIEIWRKKL